MTTDRSIEEPCEATSLTHGFEAERRGRPLRLGSALYRRLKLLGLPVECGTGGETKFNRTMRGLNKTHWLDAVCVGASTPEQLNFKGIVPLLIKAYGSGHRQMCLMDKFGFPRTKAKQRQFNHGFRTGDIVRANVPPHLNNPGIHIGRMSAKANGAFTIATSTGTVTDIGKNYCRTLQRADGYGYHLKGGATFSQSQEQNGSPSRTIYGTADAE